MATKIEASRLLIYSAAAKKARGERCDLEAGMANLFATEAAAEVTLEAMRVLGGNGYAQGLYGRAVVPGCAAAGDWRRDKRTTASDYRPRASSDTGLADQRERWYLHRADIGSTTAFLTPVLEGCERAVVATPEPCPDTRFGD